MNYAEFSAAGAESWAEHETLVAEARARGLARLGFEEVERLAALQRRIATDLAYAQTHFPGTAAERRLRGLAFAGHRLLAKRRDPLGPRFVHFFRREVPDTFCECLPGIVVALGLFWGMALAGFVITTINSDFAMLFLGSEHLAGLEEGTIWTDQLTSVAPGMLSGAIATNNMGVALWAWIGGVFFGLFTAHVVISNGLMLGSVLALTFQYGLGDRLLVFVSAHGPLELFLIAVAAGAGFELARGQLAPGLVSRAEGFRDAARRSVRLVLGTLPWFLVLGFVEGFLSPRQGVPTVLKAFVGVALLGLFLAYAFWPLFVRRPREAS